MGIFSIAKSNDSYHFSSLFSRLLDRRYQIQFYSRSPAMIISTFMTRLFSWGETAIFFKLKPARLSPCLQTKK